MQQIPYILIIKGRESRPTRPAPRAPSAPRAPRPTRPARAVESLDIVYMMSYQYKPGQPRLVRKAKAMGLYPPRLRKN